MHRLAKRLQNLPPYLFASIDAATARARDKGLEIVRMGIGDPDFDPPEWIRALLAEEVMRTGNHHYPAYKGHPQLWDAALEYLSRRFGIKGLGPEHICTTIGSKEGLANLVRAILNPDDCFIAPDPCYPVLPTMAKLAGAREFTIPLLPENNFMPELGEELSEHQKRAARLMYVNYPHNPTGKVARDKYLQSIISFALEHNVIVISDMAYSEIYYGPDNKPSSLLEFDGALNCVVELHSFSKTFSITGWRCGFAVGDPHLIKGLTTIKSNVDSGVFDAIQLTLARVLSDERCEPFLADSRARYQARMERICTALEALGLQCYRPGGAIFVWCRLPEGCFDSIEWCSQLLDTTGLVVSPGAGYGHSGEGFFRLSLTTPDDVIDAALERLAEFVRA